VISYSGIGGQPTGLASSNVDATPHVECRIVLVSDHEPPAWDYDANEARTDPVAHSLYAEALKVCSDQLAEQQRQLESMRSKVITLLGFVGAATGFMVGATLTALSTQTNPSRGFQPWALVATIVSLAAVAAAILVLVSAQWRRDSKDDKFMARWLFDFPIDKTMIWIEDVRDQTLAGLQRRMITQYRAMIHKNRRLLVNVQVTYCVFVALAALQVILWTFVIWLYG